MWCSRQIRLLLLLAWAAFVHACSGSVSAPEPQADGTADLETPVIDAPGDAGTERLARTDAASASPDAGGTPDAAIVDSTPEPDSIPALVEFTIPVGIGRGSWNTRDEVLVVYVGQTLRIHNEDDRSHILHTFGTPCEHGDTIARGEYRDHRITSPHEPDPDRAQLYDHDSGETARFWLQAIARPNEGEQ